MIHGAETQALIEKQAAKRAILQETAEKLKAVQDGAAPVETPAKPAPKPRAKKVGAEVASEDAAPKPRAPRKTKKADEA